MKKIALVLLALLWSAPAWSAACTWQGGTGNWDNSNTASWSCGHVPTSADTATFDGTSGGGTVTVCGASSANCPNGSGVVTIISLTMGAFTGTLDFSANNPNVTLTGTFSNTGTATRTLSLGNGTWLLNGGSWTMTTTTNLTFNANSSTIEFATNVSGGRSLSSGATCNGGSTCTYNNIKLDANTSAGTITFSGAITIAALTVTGPQDIIFTNSTTTALTSISGTGSSGSEIGVMTSSPPTATTLSISGASTCTWCVFRDLTFTGAGTMTATNSFGIGVNTMNGGSITPPTTGGGRIIGG